MPFRKNAEGSTISIVYNKGKLDVTDGGHFRAVFDLDENIKYVPYVEINMI